MQLLLLFCFFFIFVLFQYHVYISFLFFLFEASSRKKKCHIVLYECLYFNLFVVCQNEDLKHVAGVVTRKRRRKKTILPRMIACVFVFRGERGWRRVY